MRTKWIKKKAHAFTWAAVWWLIFFVPACFGIMGDQMEARVISGVAIALEAALVCAAAICWSLEKKQSVNWEVD